MATLIYILSPLITQRRDSLCKNYEILLESRYNTTINTVNLAIDIYNNIGHKDNNELIYLNNSYNIVNINEDIKMFENIINDLKNQKSKLMQMIYSETDQITQLKEQQHFTMNQIEQIKRQINEL